MKIQVPENHRAFYYGALRASITSAAYSLQSAQVTARDLEEPEVEESIKSVLEHLQKKIEHLDRHTLEKDYRG